MNTKLEPKFGESDDTSAKLRKDFKATEKKEAEAERKADKMKTTTQQEPEKDLDDEIIKDIDQCEEKVSTPIVALVQKQHNKPKKTKKDKEAEEKNEDEETLGEKDALKKELTKAKFNSKKFETAVKAKENAIKKDLSKRRRLPNKFTGLIHHPNGQREFPEGGMVGGVNNWLGVPGVADAKNLKSSEADEPLAEKDAKQKELVAAKKEGKKEESRQKVAKKAVSDKARTNRHTGLIHHPDGKREFPDGSAVGGVNNWIWIPPHHHAKQLHTVKKSHTHKVSAPEAHDIFYEDRMDEEKAFLHKRNKSMTKKSKKAHVKNIHSLAAKDEKAEEEAALKAASNAEAEIAKEKGAKVTAARAAKAKHEARKKRLNRWTGQEERPDGIYHFPEEHKIGGVNNWAQAKSESKVEAFSSRMARAGPDGLIHNADGTTEFVEGGKVSGANLGLNLVQSHVE